jgi:predicted DNA-binding transcriptional regulator YafY
MAKTQVDKRDQAERLLRYLELLSSGGTFAVREMAELFGIRPEGVYRDIRRLGALGYPLESENRLGRLLYRFPRQWQRDVRKVQLSIREVESALLAVEQYCRQGPPHRSVQLAVGKLQALHAECSPPARVRAWQSIVRGAGGIRTEGQGETTVIAALQRAIAESKWCELMYLPMGSPDRIHLTFAPRRFVDGTTFGMSRDLNRWDVLNLNRIADVTVTEEINTFVGEVDALLTVAPEAAESGDIERVERQVLRLVAIVRMLGAGKSALPTELASAFATTLHTIRRDRELLETNGYSTLELGSDSGFRLRQNPIVFGTIPPLPIAAGERSALVRVLERFAVHYSASDHVRGVISKLKEIPDSVVALTVSDADEQSTERDVVWELVDALLCDLPCSIIYTGHRWQHRLIVFTPKEFQFGAVLRIKGVQDPGGAEVILIVQDIRSVRILPATPGTKTREKRQSPASPNRP